MSSTSTLYFQFCRGHSHNRPYVPITTYPSTDPYALKPSRRSSRQKSKHSSTSRYTYLGTQQREGCRLALLYRIHRVNNYNTATDFAYNCASIS
ncbi:hypothetical protein I7I53_01658 [Histoplasma capsulatum var. duboisii H88]|uniref:Uncharacterized protein n=1 Tax=Ajellomyces capsulatus (strain H88) TaxID=544711 RepID=A0A8A1LQD2_AJEC8|nr:hypothetical protein I7I53_01658 [Histoplasma capsulatum var. duboisii H88]